MRWFRANRGFGGRLALFALAVQLILSFGHIHREDIYGAAIGAASSAAKLTAAADDSRPLPTDRPAGHRDGYCAICASIHLLGASFVAAAPQLALPFVSYTIEHAYRAAAAFIAPQRAPFQSRAPPLA